MEAKKSVKKFLAQLLFSAAAAFAAIVLGFAIIGSLAAPESGPGFWITTVAGTVCCLRAPGLIYGLWGVMAYIFFDLIFGHSYEA